MTSTEPTSARLNRQDRQSLDHDLAVAFLENIPDVIYFKDRESRFIAVSRSLEILHDRQRGEILGKTDFDLFSEAHARAAFADEQEIIRTGQPIIGKVERETWPDGRITWVLTTKLPLCNAEGEVVGTFGISKDVTQSKETELTLEQTQRQLIDASRTAGMAEVATGVLHNVGNVLNSLNVSATVIASGLRNSKTENLTRVAELFRRHAADLGDYLTRDPKGRRLPEFIESLAQHAAAERTRLLKEIESLKKNVDHIKEIVAMQQAYATMVGVIEPLDPAELMEDSLRMNAGALMRHSVAVVREFQPVPPVLGEKAKVLQILVNLIRNAKYAADESGRPDKRVTLRIQTGETGRVQLIVADNGVGIAPENLTRIFAHGFTTRAGGHGFGLHSSAIAAREMKGTLSVTSDGPGQGATFMLELPSA